MSQPTYQQLLGVLAEKDRQIAELQDRVTQLEARLAQLEQFLEKATRAQKRQAAPFSKGTPKQDPKTPGASRATPTAPRPIGRFPNRSPTRSSTCRCPNNAPSAADRPKNTMWINSSKWKSPAALWCVGLEFQGRL